MQQFFGLLLVLFIFVCSCNSGQKADNSSATADTLNLSNDPLLSKFNLHLDKSQFNDTNDLVFYRTKPFDTTFLVHIKPQGSQVVGNYYEVLPTYHRDTEGYTESNINFLFFQGFSFTIDQATWQGVKTAAGPIINDIGRGTGTNLCFDCSSYFFAYDKRGIYNDSVNKTNFEHFSEYIKTNVINKVNIIRKKFQK